MKFMPIEGYTTEFRQALYDASSKQRTGVEFSNLETEKQDVHIKAIDEVIAKHNLIVN